MASYPNALAKAVEMEEKIFKFYTVAAEQSMSLMADCSEEFPNSGKETQKPDTKAQIPCLEGRLEMAKTIEKRSINCSIRHIKAFIIKYDNGSFTVKCGNLKICGDSCPYLKDPDYETKYKRAPAYKAK